MKKLVLAAAAAFTLQAGAVSAEDFYLGGKLGGYDVEEGFVDINELALGAYFGYRFNEYVSVEAEYVNLFEDSTFGVDVDGDLWAVSVRPTLPLDDEWELYAKAGWGWLDVEADGGFVSTSGTDDDFIWGLGIQWNGPNFHVRGEVQSDTDVPDFLIYTVGIGVSF